MPTNTPYQPPKSKPPISRSALRGVLVYILVCSACILPSYFVFDYFGATPAMLFIALITVVISLFAIYRNIHRNDSSP